MIEFEDHTYFDPPPPPFSRVGPHRQVQQQFISEMEDSLLRHPFELYPHLEESIKNPEVSLWGYLTETLKV